jgi:tetratricopeptide (TPR) repeat protein
LYRAALSIRRRLHGSNDLEVAKLLNGLGLVLSGAGRYGVATVFVGGGRDAESEAAHQEAMRIQRARLPGDDPELAYSLSGLAFALEMQGKVAEAESMLRKALEIRKQAFGEENVLVANTLTDLGWFMKRHGRYREEGDFFRQALVTRRKLLGNEHPMLAADIAQLADAFVNQGNLAEAEVLWRNLVSRHGQGAWAGNAGFAVQYLLATFRTQERHAEAETFLEDEFEHGGRAELNSIAWFLGTAWSADPRDASNAVRFAEKAVAQTARKDPYDLDTLAVALAAAGDFVKAVSVEKEAIALARDDGLRAQLESHLRLYEMSFAPSRVRALKREGRLEEATALLDQAIEHFTPSSLNNLAWALATHSEPLGRDGPTAIRFAERAVAATKRKEARYLDTLAAAFAETGDFASAVAVQKEAIAAQPGPPRPDFQLRLEMYETNAPWRQIVLILEE